MPPILQQLQSMSPADITEAATNSHPESDHPPAHSMKAHDLAMDLVHDRHSKRELVDLVRWLILGAPATNPVKLLERHNL